MLATFAMNSANKNPSVIPTGTASLFPGCAQRALAAQWRNLSSIAKASQHRSQHHPSFLILPGRIKRQQLRHPPRPSRQVCRPAKRNNQRQHSPSSPPSPSSAPNRWSRSRADQSHPQTSGIPSRFKSYLPIPLYVSPRARRETPRLRSPPPNHTSPQANGSPPKPG